MWIFIFYRFYISLFTGAVVWLVLTRPLWLGIISAILTRIAWLGIERVIEKIIIGRDFAVHAAPFKELCGPYGIRLINRAETDMAIKSSLVEVFTPSIKKLEKAVRNLELMETLYSAGMRPDGDAWQLHDLKLKYARHRLQHSRKKHPGTS